MIEKQVYNAYAKLKKRLRTTIDSDNFFEDFISILRSGNRTYSQHNVEVNKYIDETWVKAIEAAIPSLEIIINNPRKFIESIAEVMPVELARKINVNSIKHLAANTQYVSHVNKDGTVIPSKILSSYNEESFDIYENRFVMTLLNKVDHFIDIRYFVLGERAGNEYTSEMGLKGKFDQNDEKTTYDFRLKIEQGPRYLTAGDDTVDIFERLGQVRSYIQEFKRSHFARVMGALPQVRMPINKTNLLMKSVDYKACYDLWEFMDQYTKVGYRMEILETDPKFSESFTNEAELLVLCNYLLLKNYMSEYLETQKSTVKRRREIDPKFAERNQIELVDTNDIKDYKTLLAAIRQGKSQRVANTVLKAITRALDQEEQKKQAEISEVREREGKIASVIRNAIQSVSQREKEEREQVLKTVKGAEVAMAITRTLDAAGIDYDDGYDLSDRPVTNLSGEDDLAEDETEEIISVSRRAIAKEAKELMERAKVYKEKPEPKAKSKIVKEGIISYDDVDDISAILEIMNKRSEAAAALATESDE